MVFAQGENSNTATGLNTQGYRFYQNKDFGKAVEYFTKATEKDPKFALAHYNLACTLAILRSQGKVCQYDAFPSSILRHLSAAIQIDPSRKEKMIRDSDLQSVHSTVGYQKLLGLSPENPEELKKILQRVPWFGEGRTLDPQPLEELRFYPNGKAILRTRSVTEKNQRLVFGKWRSTEGSYAILQNGIDLKLKKTFQHPVSGEITDQFRIEVDFGPMEQVNQVASLKLLAPNGTSLHFYDSPSECEVF